MPFSGPTTVMRFFFVFFRSGAIQWSDYSDEVFFIVFFVVFFRSGAMQWSDYSDESLLPVPLSSAFSILSLSLVSLNCVSTKHMFLPFTKMWLNNKFKNPNFPRKCWRSQYSR